MSCRWSRSRSGCSRSQRLELSDHVEAADRHVGLDPVLEAAEAQLLEVRALDAGERLRELGQGRAAPESERIGEQRRGGGHVAGRERRAAVARADGRSARGRGLSGSISTM